MKDVLLEKLRTQPTISVPEAAELIGVCRNGGYDAANSGELPTIRVGRSIKVISASLRKMLGIEPAV